jgi:hypothetical protein
VDPLKDLVEVEPSVKETKKRGRKKKEARAKCIYII